MTPMLDFRETVATYVTNVATSTDVDPAMTRKSYSICVAQSSHYKSMLIHLLQFFASIGSLILSRIC